MSQARHDVAWWENNEFSKTLLVVFGKGEAFAEANLLKGTMATIRKREGKKGISYQVQVRLKGGGLETASFKSLTKAKLWAQSIEASIREGRHFTSSESKKHTLNDLIERFLNNPGLKSKTSLQYTSQLQWWSEQLGTLTLSEITPDKIATKRDKLLSNGYKTSSANRYVAALSSACAMASREFGWIQTNPCSKIRKLSEPRGRTRYLSDEERGLLIEACEKSGVKELFIIVVLALNTGARKNELRWLRWSDVDLQKGTLMFQDTKNDMIRSIPVVGRGLDILREWGKLRRLDTDLVFPGKNPENPVLFEKSWRNALKSAGIEDFRFHDLRHSAASYLAMNGVPIRTIAEILGHKTLGMVQRYSHLNPEHLRSEISRTMKEVNL